MRKNIRVKKNGASGKNALIDRCDALYIWNKDPIYRMALRAVGGDRTWAFEILERCMARAFRHIDRFDDARSERSKSIIAAMLQSEINQIYEKAQRMAGAPEERTRPPKTKKDRLNVNQVLIRNELSAGLARYVERLTSLEKELVFFRYFVGLTEEEMGERFQCGPDELHDKLFFVKQRLSNLILEGQWDALTLEDRLPAGNPPQDHVIEGQLQM